MKTQMTKEEYQAILDLKLASLLARFQADPETMAVFKRLKDRQTQRLAGEDSSRDLASQLLERKILRETSWKFLEKLLGKTYLEKLLGNYYELTKP